MRLPVSVGRAQAEFNMTPMIDVVFLLIIFFLVSSHLAKQEVHLDLPLPAAVTGEKRVDDQAPRLTINIAPQGRLMLAGRRVQPGELRQRFQRQLDRDGADVEVVIRGDRTVPYGQVEPVMLACAEAGIWNVTFSVIHPQDAQQ